MFLKKHISFK